MISDNDRAEIRKHLDRAAEYMEKIRALLAKSKPTETELANVASYARASADDLRWVDSIALHYVKD